MIPILEIAPNLTAREVSCRCMCGLHAVHGDLLWVWSLFRPKLGPLRVVSGVRCVRHNANVGGSPNSQHLLGRALDLQPLAGQDLNDDTARRIFLASGVRGLGRFLGGDGVHVDARKGPMAFWKYTDRGMVPDEPVAKEG